jgi:predicted transcriptional regulator
VKATVIYLLDGIVQRRTFKGKRITVHIHKDRGKYKRGYVRVGGVEHFYSSVIRMKRGKA